MAVESWFFEENLKPFVSTLASIAGYEFGDDDWLAVRGGVKRTDAEGGRWFDYVFGRVKEIRFALAHDGGTRVIHFRCSADGETESKIDLLVEIAQSYRLEERGRNP